MLLIFVMRDSFLENDFCGIPSRPTDEQWANRSEQFNRMMSAAILNAEQDTSVDNASYVHHSPIHGFNVSLSKEMERCFCSGCWISVVCIGMAAVDAFSHEIWGHGRVKKELKKIDFPHISWWESLRKKRNSIMHINESSDHDKADNYDLHYYAKMTVWFSCYYIDYICLWQKANGSVKK